MSTSTSKNLVWFNRKKTVDMIAMDYYEKNSLGRSFSEFVKHLLFQHAVQDKTITKELIEQVLVEVPTSEGVKVSKQHKKARESKTDRTREENHKPIKKETIPNENVDAHTLATSVNGQQDIKNDEDDHALITEAVNKFIS